MLIENFAERTKMRQAESKAIQDAIGILQAAAYAYAPAGRRRATPKRRFKGEGFQRSGSC